MGCMGGTRIFAVWGRAMDIWGKIEYVLGHLATHGNLWGQDQGHWAAVPSPLALPMVKWCPTVYPQLKFGELELGEMDLGKMERHQAARHKLKHADTD